MKCSKKAYIVMACVFSVTGIHMLLVGRKISALILGFWDVWAFLFTLFAYKSPEAFGGYVSLIDSMACVNALLWVVCDAFLLVMEQDCVGGVARPIQPCGK